MNDLLLLFPPGYDFGTNLGFAGTSSAFGYEEMCRRNFLDGSQRVGLSFHQDECLASNLPYFFLELLFLSVGSFFC